MSSATAQLRGIERAAAGTISSVVPAPAGWYYVTPVRRDGATVYTRTRVAGWAIVDYDDGRVVEPLVAGDGPFLVLASVNDPADEIQWHRGRISDGLDGACDCGRARGDDPDPRWSPECAAEIPR